MVFLHLLYLSPKYAYLKAIQFQNQHEIILFSHGFCNLSSRILFLEIQILVGKTFMSRFHVRIVIELPLED